MKKKLVSCKNLTSFTQQKLQQTAPAVLFTICDRVNELTGLKSAGAN